MTMTPRLITIAFSHYCEKARWALDRADIDYVEDAHLPLFSYLPLVRAGAKRTAPALVTDDGTVLVDSTDILRWCDAHGRAEPLFPPGDDEVVALKEEFDRHLGPATRRLGYFYLLKDKRATLDVLAKHGPRWERVLGKASRPLAAALLRRGLRIDPAGAERSRAVIDRTFSEIGERLRDGRKYLCGDRLTAADLTFAALAAPVLLPDQYSEYLPREELVPPAFREVADAYRATPAGEYGLRMYLER
ncbi:MAG: glutathione S-transferase family protein [Kofleriaceae bacterium]|nr:MAG: glutathione S-transferase family protein [Kofleriaceae bacterium]